MTKNYRPAVAWPVDLAQEDEHFASGCNHAGEIRGLALSGRLVGITATTSNPKLVDELELYSGGLLRIFVDSGAFSEVKFSEKLGRLVVKKPITDKSWVKRLALAERIARKFGHRALLVAPDLVGDQDATLARLTKWAPQVAACAAYGAHIIVPVQKGKLPMSAMFRTACEILGLAETPIAGIPMKKDATSIKDLAELVDSMPWFGARFHLLGLGPESPRYAAVIRCIKSRRPNAKITTDSVTVRRLAGRKNGRGGGPRALTKYQDVARAMGMTDAAKVKAYGLMRQGGDEYNATLDRAHAAGWFDEELYDSLEEALAHRAAGYPDAAREPAPARVAKAKRTKVAAAQLALCYGAAA
jgi:hypothetical protein